MKVVQDSRAPIIVIGNGLAGRSVAKMLTKSFFGNIVCIDSRSFYEPDSIAPVFLNRPDIEKKYTVSQTCYHVEGVAYVEGVVQGVSTCDDEYNVMLHSGKSHAASAVVVCVGASIPLFKPALGASQAARAAELAAARKAITEADTILVAGGGTVGVEVAGAAALLKKPSAKLLVAVSGDTILSSDWPAGVRERLAKHMLSHGVTEIMGHSKVIGEASQVYSTTPGTYTLESGKTIAADVFLPAFSTVSAPFMAAVEGAVSPRGAIAVDSTLQSVKMPGVFAVACTSVDTIVNMLSIQAQCKVVAHNVHAYLERQPLRAYTGPSGPKMDAEPWVHYQWGVHSVVNLPPPCNICGICCGWPLPCFCCLPGCCMPCGFSCCPPEGQGVSQFMNTMVLEGKKGPPQAAHLKHEEAPASTTMRRP